MKLKTLNFTKSMKSSILFHLLLFAGAHFPQNGLTQVLEHGSTPRMNWEFQRLRDPNTNAIPQNIRFKEIAFVNTMEPKISNNEIAINGTNWFHRGPYFIGGRTRALGIDKFNENRIIAGSVSGGMWLSADRGKTWKPTQLPHEFRSITCVEQDNRVGKGQFWYAGTGEAYGQSAGAPGAYYFGDGLLVSSDSGKSWKQINSTSMATPNAFTSNWQLTWNLALDPTAESDSTVLYAATYGSVFRTNNAGSTWVNVINAGSYFTDVVVSNTGKVYAAMSSDGSKNKTGFWRSTDGLNFVNITPPQINNKAFKRTVINMDPSDENTLYFLMNTTGWGKVTANSRGELEYNALFKLKIEKNSQGLDTFIYSDLSQNLPSGKMFDRWLTQGSYDMLVRVHPNNSDIVYIGGTNIYRSTSAFTDSLNTTMIGGYKKGGTFPHVGVWPNQHPDQHGLEFFKSNPNEFISSNDGGLFYSKDNLADSVIWESLNNGYLTTQFYTVAIDPTTHLSPVIIAGAQDNNQIITNKLESDGIWQEAYFGDGSYCAIESGGKNFYFSKQLGKTIRAEVDVNMKRTKYRRIDPIGAFDYGFINPFILDPNKNNVMYMLGGRSVWRNNKLSEIELDNSNDSISFGWVRTKDSLVAASLSFTAIAATLNEPKNRVYLGTNSKYLYKIENADSGDFNFTRLTSPTVNGDANASCISVNPNNGNDIMVSYSNYGVYSIFHSMDGGQSWTKVAGNLEENSLGTGNGPSVRWLNMLPVADGMIYFAATSAGLFATDSLQGLQTVWIQQAGGEIGNIVCDMIVSRPTDGSIVLATHGNGIYSSRLFSKESLLKIRTHRNASVDVFSVYPNPTDGILNIVSKVSKFDGFRIYNSHGHLVKEKYGSSHEFKGNAIDVSDLPEGIYYLTVMNSSNQVISWIKFSKLD